MMPDSTLLTIILNYKTAPMTLRAVAAALVAMDGIAGEIIIVDNASGDGSFERIHAHIAENNWGENNRVRVLQSDLNGGFGAGNNIGIRSGFSDGSKPDYVYILNSDAFPAPDAIRRLLEHLETTPEAGFAGSYIHGEEGDPHLTSFRFPSIASEFESAIRFGPITRLLKNRIVPIPVPDQTRPVDWLAGASLMMRQNVLDEVGLFDEKFFLYFEETDLCRRAVRAGHRTDYVRDSHVMHIGSVSTGMKKWQRVPNYWFDSRLHYFVKNHGVVYAAGATLAHLTGGLFHFLRCLITRKPRSATPFFLLTMTHHDLTTLFRILILGRKSARHPNPVVGE